MSWYACGFLKLRPVFNRFLQGFRSYIRRITHSTARRGSKRSARGASRLSKKLPTVRRGSGDGSRRRCRTIRATSSGLAACFAFPPSSARARLDVNQPNSRAGQFQAQTFGGGCEGGFRGAVTGVERNRESRPQRGAVDDQTTVAPAHVRQDLSDDLDGAEEQRLELRAFPAAR